MEAYKCKLQEKYLTTEQVEVLFKYIENSELDAWRKVRYRWIFILFLLTGLRKTEAANLVMADFIKLKGKWWLKVLGKGKKNANIPITEDLIQELSVYRTYNGLSALPGPSEKKIPVIMRRLNKRNNKIDYANYSISNYSLYSEIKFIFQNIYNDLKVEDEHLAENFRIASTHWLRHTSATLQIEAEIPLHIVKENLRHEEISTTMRYVHTDKDIQHAEITNKFKGITFVSKGCMVSE